MTRYGSIHGTVIPEQERHLYGTYGGCVVRLGFIYGTVGVYP